MSFWYTREQAQPRFTIYWCSVLTANAFGGLLASAIANMNGIRGMSSWRWIFILEGIATILIGVAAFFVVSDFPEDARWINEEERSFIAARAANERETRAITIRDTAWIFRDPKNIAGALMYFGRRNVHLIKEAAWTDGFNAGIIVPTYGEPFYPSLEFSTLLIRRSD